MRNGTVKCDCGQLLSISTSMNVIECPKCRTKYDVSHIPNIPEVEEEVDPLAEKRAEIKAEIEAAVNSIILKM